ncbi:MAG: type II toxin-antitoxin system RelE/ParE family toxin [Cyanobacteria bacterium P01_F01_bin.56]
MTSENGSPRYRVIPSDKFARALKTLKKSYKSKREAQAFADAIGDIVDNLIDQPRPDSSRLEPWPANLASPNDWEFRKLVFPIPARKGASGEGRLMYLVNDQRLLVRLVWLYTHEEFKKRPPEKDLKTLMRELLDDPESS